MRCLVLIALAMLVALPAAWAMPPRPGLDRIDPTHSLSWVEKPNLEGLTTIVTKDGQRIMVSTLAKGTKKYPVLLIDYSDVVAPAAHTAAKFDSALFLPHGIASGSLADYYLEASYNNFQVQGGCYGWHQSGQTLNYYGNGTNGLSNTYPRNSAGLVVRALKLADAAGVDFTQFSSSGGKLDLVIVIHAGEGAEGGSGNADQIWSHNGRLSGWSGVTVADRTVDGLQVDNYTIQPGISSITHTTMIEIGVIAHELGHGVGLPDLYDTDPAATASNGLGCWSLMASGSWGGDYNHPQYPSHPDAWCKKYLGWATTRNVGVNNRDSLAQVESSPQLLTLWKNGSPGSQYFLIENRQQTGFDTLLFDAGLLVYHVDETVINTYLASNTINWKSHGLYGVALEEANHATHLWNGTNPGDANDAFASGNSFAPPYSDDNGSQITNVQIGNISSTGPVMWADYTVGSDFNISLLQNPAFSYNLGISMVSNYRLLNPGALDTAYILRAGDAAVPLQFGHSSGRTFQASYLLQTWGDFTIRIAARDSDSTAVYRRGSRNFGVRPAKAAGGRVNAMNGAVQLEFPAGAVARDELWVICPQDASNPGAIAASPAFHIGPNGRILTVPAELTLRFDPAALNGRDPARLGICQLSNGRWRRIGGRLDPSGRSVSAPIHSADVYQLCWSESFPVMPLAHSVMPVTANPSPFARTTTISYQLDAPSQVSLKVYNIAGQLVRTISDGYQDAGAHAAAWDGRGDRNSRQPSGIYHYRLWIDGRTATGRMVKVE